MTSLQTRTKQIASNNGYYINVGSVGGVANGTFYTNSGTEAVPLMSTSIWCVSSPVSTILKTAGAAIFRDHGKTLLSSGRVFRKVQLLLSTGAVAYGNGTDGVSGVPYASTSNPGYFTGYIELPGAGGYSSGTPSFTPVARLG